jgi:hypothetical protein
VVLDGICSSNMCRAQTYDLDLDSVGGDVLALCDRSAGCVEHLGGRSSRRLAEDVFAALDAGTQACAASHLPQFNLTRARLGKWLGTMLTQWYSRWLVWVAMVEVFGRCGGLCFKVCFFAYMSYVSVPCSRLTLPATYSS